MDRERVIQEIILAEKAMFCQTSKHCQQLLTYHQRALIAVEF